MRKGLTVLLVIAALLAVFSEAVLPSVASGLLHSYLTESLATNDIQTSVTSRPAIKILGGRVESVQAVAHASRLGEVRLSELSLSGEDLKLNIPWQDWPDLSSTEIESAKKLELQGIFTEENLRELITAKVDKLENVEVKITPQHISLKGNAKIFGRVADVYVEGVIVEEAKALYFHLTRLDITGVRTLRSVVGDFLDDILLTREANLPPQVKFDNVEMLEGKVIITASWHENG